MGRARAQWLQPGALTRLSGFESWLHCVLAVWPQVSYLPSLGLCFLICPMGLITVSGARGCHGA